MKSKITTVVVLALFGVMFIVITFLGARILFRKKNPTEKKFETACTIEKGEWVTFRARYAEDSGYTVKHTLNGIIPFGKEYYYAVYSDELDCIVIIRAGKKWYEKNFTMNQANDPDGCLISGYVRSTENGVERTFTNYRNNSQDYIDLPIKLQGNLYVDTLATRYAIMQILIGILPLFFAILIFIGSRTGLFEQTPDSAAAKGILSVVIIGFLLYVALLTHFLAMM